MRRNGGWLVGVLVVALGLWACEAEPGDGYEEAGWALSAAGSAPTAPTAVDDAADTGDEVLPVCRAGSLAGLSESDEEPTLSATDDAARAGRIEVTVKVAAVGSYLRIGVRFTNPYRCHWTGDLYLERETPAGDVVTVARRYGVTIRGGSSVGGWLFIERPEELGEHRFFARAYAADGEDRQGFTTCLVNAADTAADAASTAACLPDEAVPDAVDAGDVVSATFDDPGAAADEVDPCATAVAARPPIFVDLWLEHTPRTLTAYAAWENTTRRPWQGDLYVDLTGPHGGVRLLRRDLGVRMEPGIGFCSFDETRRPQAPGVYVVRARALRRDGSGLARWRNPGTTEITAVCNRQVCELVPPDARAARLTLTGPGQIHLASDFYAERTEVLLAWGGRTWDVTDRCRIEQELAGGRNHVSVRFDTFDLPIGPRTWALYTVRLHPMPVVPPGAKTSDALWILTNGGE